MDAFEEVARLFGFRMMEPAPLERIEVLRAKSGADVDKEIYSFKDKGGREIGLRFDLTVGMTRYVCGRRDLRPPVKLAALSGAWRYDEPQHARYRWFKQWDLEIFGPPSLESDAEVIEASYRLFDQLGLGRVSVRVGDRDAVQQFVIRSLGVGDEKRGAEMMRALDKVQKKTPRELKSEYEAKGFSSRDVDSLLEFGRIRDTPEKVLSRLDEAKVDAPTLRGLADSLRERGVQAEFDLGVVRGIDYYTGMVFEIVDGEHADSGSLAGGGRYDLLPATFGRPDLSGTGAAGGVERAVLSLPSKTGTFRQAVYVATAGPKAHAESRRILRRLRERGVASESSLAEKPLSKQLEDADRAGASWVILLGDRELEAGTVTLRDMAGRREEKLTLEAAIARVLGG